MRKSLMSLLALSTALSCGTAAQAHAKHHHHHATPVASATSAEFDWQNAGADRAFLSRETAMAARPQIFAKEGYSPTDIQLLITATDGPSGRAMIMKGNRFMHMFSSHMNMHTNVVAQFKKVLNGESDEVAGLFLWSEYWDVTLTDGRKVRVFLPVICRNWADEDLAPPPAPPPPQAAEDECAYEASWVDQGDTVLAGDAMPANPAPSTCWAQQKPGETQLETNWGWDCKDVCTLDNPDKDVGNLPIYPVTRESFVAQVSGWYIRRIPLWATKAEANHYSLYCDDRPDGLRSYGKAITSRDYAMDGDKLMGYIVYQAWQQPKTFADTNPPLVWHFQQPR